MAVIYMGPTGGLSAADKANLLPANIKAGVTIKKVTGSFTADGTAAASDILNGKTAYVNGGKVTGTVPVSSEFSFIVPMFSSSPMTIPAGYYSSPISVTPSYTSGTKITDFRSSGPLGQALFYRDSSRCQTSDSNHSEANGSVTLYASGSTGDNGEEVGGASARLVFANPLNSAGSYRYAVVTGSISGTGSAWSEAGVLFRSGVGDYTGFGEVKGIGASVTTNATNKYLMLKATTGWIRNHSSIRTTVTITSITLYT